MTETRLVRGVELRYALTMYLQLNGPTTVGALVDGLERWGLRVDGRASKAVSDALRWEMLHDRVRRLARGRYGPSGMPRGTEHRIRRRVNALRAEAAELSLEGRRPTSFSRPADPWRRG